MGRPLTEFISLSCHQTASSLTQITFTHTYTPSSHISLDHSLPLILFLVIIPIPSPSLIHPQPYLTGFSTLPNYTTVLLPVTFSTKYYPSSSFFFSFNTYNTYPPPHHSYTPSQISLAAPSLTHITFFHTSTPSSNISLNHSLPLFFLVIIPIPSSITHTLSAIPLNMVKLIEI